MRKKFSPLLVLGIVLFFPKGIFATQQHPAPTGLVVHQIAHLMFVVAMLILLLTIKKTVGVKIEGWKNLYKAAVFFMIWNAIAFFVHGIQEFIPKEAYTGQGYWGTYLSLGEQSFVRIVFYVGKVIAPLLNVIPFYYLHKSLKSFRSIAG